MSGYGFGGVPVVVSPVLPIEPTPGQDARRMVRHGMADVLAWLGEDVGPAPGAKTHALLIAGSLHVSPTAMVWLREGGAA